MPWVKDDDKRPPFGSQKLCCYRRSASEPWAHGICWLNGNDFLSEWIHAGYSVVVMSWFDGELFPVSPAAAEGVDYRAKLLEDVLTCIDDYHNGWVNRMATRARIRKLFSLVPPSPPAEPAKEPSEEPRG